MVVHGNAKLDEPQVLRNEFAMVEVSIVDRGNDPKLRIRDPEHGVEILLDPLELEALTRCHHRKLAPLLDPSGMSVLDRWYEHTDGGRSPTEA